MELSVMTTAIPDNGLLAISNVVLQIYLNKRKVRSAASATTDLVSRSTCSSNTYRPISLTLISAVNYTGIYFCCNMTLIALTSVVSALIVYISHHYQDKPVPLWARKVCNLIGYVLL